MRKSQQREKTMPAICDRPLDDLKSLCAQQIPKPIPDHGKIDAQWQASLDELIKPCNPKLQAIREFILKNIGGGEVLISMGDTSEAEPLMEHSQLWVPKASDIDYLAGENNHCHDNACTFWKENPEKYVIATGYGLSPDGLWRPHSWLMEPQNDSDAKIVETTVGRLAYLGRVLDLPNTIDFVYGNLPSDLKEKATQLLRKSKSPQP
jgi:hypothetical protein